MATHTFVDVEMEEARYLADLNGIQIDLEIVIKFCNYFLNIYSIEKLDSTLQEILTIAILVKYSRSFLSGVRSKLSISDVPGLTEEELAEHGKFIALRNKYIAHSVNEYEENKVVARYNDEKVYDEGITSISIQHTRLISISAYDVQAIIFLSRKILDYVDTKIKVEKDKILSLVRNQPINEVLEKGASSSKNPNINNVNKRRK